MHSRDVALTDILLSIEDSCSHYVINLDDPKSVWGKLHEMYKIASAACIDTHLVRLQNLKMGNDEKGMSYANRLVSVENYLAAIGHSIDQKDKKRSLLKGRRREFQTTAKGIRAVTMSFTRAFSEQSRRLPCRRAVTLRGN